MKKYLSTYRPFLRFLLVFFVSYGLLSFLYNHYLSHYENQQYPVDPFTEHVSYQVKTFAGFFGLDIETHKVAGERWTQLVYNDRYVARVVEGCNALSVMILFVSFVLAFAGKPFRTLAFITIGILLIHSMNIARIAALTSLMYHYPEHTHLLHGILFPLVIYGFVFILWIVWIKKYSGFITAKR